MKGILAVAVMILCITSNAHGDFFYKLVGYECDEKADAVILTYSGALNEAGKKMLKNKGPRQWDPWSLIIRDTKNRDLIASHKNINNQCTLSDGVYDITIGPQPGNANLQGKCGGFMSAWAEVKHGQEIILPRHSFEFGDCHMAEPVTVKVVVETGGKKPVITKIPWDVFYKRTK
jgi:hypothetical protein